MDAKETLRTAILHLSAGKWDTALGELQRLTDWVNDPTNPVKHLDHLSRPNRPIPINASLAILKYNLALDEALDREELVYEQYDSDPKPAG